MTGGGDQVLVAARLQPQHAEARLGIVEGDPLDHGRQRFPRRVGDLGAGPHRTRLALQMTCTLAIQAPIDVADVVAIRGARGKGPC